MWRCNYYNGMGCYHMFFGSRIMELTITILIIAIIAMIISKLIGQNQIKDQKTHKENYSFEMLKMRFVKGEIDEQEFARMKKILGY